MGRQEIARSIFALPDMEDAIITNKDDKSFNFTNECIIWSYDNYIVCFCRIL